MDNQNDKVSVDREVSIIRQSLERLCTVNECNVMSTVLSKKAAAMELGISYRTIERWRQKGYIRPQYCVGRIYYSQAEIQRVAMRLSLGSFEDEQPKDIYSLNTPYEQYMESRR